MTWASFRNLYYIAPIQNLPSILREGILAHRLVVERDIQFTSIYDSKIVHNRRERKISDNTTLWDYANLYFQPRNPMLYRIVLEQGVDTVAILAVRPDILSMEGVYVSLGNAASKESDILPASKGLPRLQRELGQILRSDWWGYYGTKRKIMAECLVPERVPPEFIHSIYVASRSVASQVEEKIRPSPIPVIAEPYMFFQPKRQFRVTGTLSLADGDMFFSRMHTLTISVNTVGVMVKGLASRAKYQFPDVYVYYQDLCRTKRLKMGQPRLYKREESPDLQLVEDPTTLNGLSDSRWFLLFPTKNHWREKSSISGIEEGLRWVSSNYKKEGIRSLALPALGCGLGGLSWADVGPLMCRYLAHLDINVVIYLPQEQEIPSEWLGPTFLLKHA